VVIYAFYVFWYKRRILKTKAAIMKENTKIKRSHSNQLSENIINDLKKKLEKKENNVSARIANNESIRKVSPIPPKKQLLGEKIINDLEKKENSSSVIIANNKSISAARKAPPIPPKKKLIISNDLEKKVEIKENTSSARLGASAQTEFIKQQIELAFAGLAPLGLSAPEKHVTIEHFGSPPSESVKLFSNARLPFALKFQQSHLIYCVTKSLKNSILILASR
jgi:hypothetical protein